MLKCNILCEGSSQSGDQGCTVWQTFLHLLLPLNSDVLITNRSSLEVTLGPLPWKEPIKESPIQVRLPHNEWWVRCVSWLNFNLFNAVYVIKKFQGTKSNTLKKFMQLHQPYTWYTQRPKRIIWQILFLPKHRLPFISISLLPTKTSSAF